MTKAIKDQSGERRQKKRGPRRRLGKLTREGRVFFLVTVGVGIAAVNTGNNLLYLMLGLLLSLLLVSMVLSEVALYGLRLTSATLSGVTAGEATVFEVAVHNKKRWLPSYAIELQSRDTELLQLSSPIRLIKLAAQTTSSGRSTATFKRRGRHRINNLAVITRYPFGLVEKVHLHRVAKETLVYPQEERFDYTEAAPEHAGSEALAHLPGPGTEVAGVRDYHDGDDARAIHPLRSATLGRWVVRERERDAAPQLCLALDTLKPDKPGSEFDAKFEQMVRQATYVSKDALRRGTAVRILTSESSSEEVGPGASPEPLLAFLAELQPMTAPGRVAGGGRRSNAQLPPRNAALLRLAP